MQDIIARALALRNNSSSNLNSAVKAIQPLSEIVNYGAEYTYRYADYGNSELVKITADTQANNIVFITAADSKRITIQFWDANGRQNSYLAALNGCTFITITNNDVISDGNLQRNIVITAPQRTRYIYYNADGTFKSFEDSAIAYDNEVLTLYNRTEYTPTADYHPATKKYVDDAIPTSLNNPYPLIFTGATSATYDGSKAVTVDLPSGGSVSGYKIVTVTLDADSSRVDISKTATGEALSTHELYWIALTKSATTANEKYSVLINGGWSAGDPYISPNHATSKSTDTWFNPAYGHMIVQDGVALSTNMTQGSGKPNALGVYSKYTEIESVSFAQATFAAGCTFILIYR